MKHLARSLLGAATCVPALLASSAQAALITLDFDALALSGATSYTESGATITAPGGTFSSVLTPNGTNGLISDIPRQSMRVDFGVDVTDVSVDMGDLGFDLDIVFMEAYDAADALIASIGLGCCDIAEMVTLGVTDSLTPISYVVLGSDGQFPNSVAIDNLAFETAAVPEPTSLALMAGAFGAMGFANRRRKRKAQTA